MIIETSSYNDMVIKTLVADIWAFKTRFFVKMTTLGNILVNKNNILTKNRFLNVRMSATSVSMITSLYSEIPHKHDT